MIRYNLTPGDCILVTKNFKTSQLHFRKTASTWWGRNIYSVMRIMTGDDEYQDFHKDQILFIATQTPVPNNLSIGSKIHGLILEYRYHHGWKMDNHPNDYDRQDTMFHILFLALLQGFAKIVKYDSLIDSAIVYDINLLHKIHLVDQYSSSEITVQYKRVYHRTERKFDWYGSTITVKVKDDLTKERLPDLIFSEKEFLEEKFYSDGKLIPNHLTF